MTIIVNGFIAPPEPGFYSLEAEAYHKDPAPEPSLSASIGLPLLHQSAAHARWRHPRLNPEHEEENARRMDVGTVAHKLLLGIGGEVAIIDADSFRTKAAQADRDAAYELGHTPVLAKDYETAEKMAVVARDAIERGLPKIDLAHAETVMFWREGKAWCRSMVDLLSDDGTWIVDYKTTGRTANPRDVRRTLYSMGYDFKMAFYERGLDVLDPGNRGRRRHAFLFQETFPPYACSFSRVTEGDMTIARKQVTAAIAKWQYCIEHDDWPGYPLFLHDAERPVWSGQEWAQRVLAGEEFLTGATSPDGYVEPHDPTAQEYGGWAP